MYIYSKLTLLMSSAIPNLVINIIEPISRAMQIFKYRKLYFSFSRTRGFLNKRRGTCVQSWLLMLISFFYILCVGVAFNCCCCVITFHIARSKPAKPVTTIEYKINAIFTIYSRKLHMLLYTIDSYLNFLWSKAEF